MLLTGGWWPLYPAFFPPFFFFFLHLIITSPQHLHLITSTQQHPPQFSLIGFLQSEFIEWFPPSYESEGKPFLNISIIHCCEKKSHGKLESLPPVSVFLYCSLFLSIFLSVPLSFSTWSEKSKILDVILRIPGLHDRIWDFMWNLVKYLGIFRNIRIEIAWEIY